MTAERYVAHMGRLRGLDRREAETRSRLLFDRLALSPGPHVPIGELSRGNSQKVALTQAFLAPARLLVLDEPYGALDAPAAAELTDLIDEAWRAGSAVVLSSHDPGHRADSTTDYYLIAGGRLQPLAAPAAPASDRPPPTTQLVLRAADDRATPPDLALLPDIHAVRTTPVTGEIIVVTTDADAVLRWALAGGWSFRSGGPADPAAECEPR
jgi:energy-coupling factor transporter ATP-binding protein EcfA2